jgi:hypothetical protein
MTRNNDKHATAPEQERRKGWNNWEYETVARGKDTQVSRQTHCMK